MTASRSHVVARKLSLHTPLTAAAREALDPFLGRARDYARGSLICQAGDPPNVISIVKSGMACAPQRSNDRMVKSL